MGSDWHTKSGRICLQAASGRCPLYPLVSRSPGKLQRLLWQILMDHGRPVTFAEIRGKTRVGNSRERRARRALHPHPGLVRRRKNRVRRWSSEKLRFNATALDHRLTRDTNIPDTMSGMRALLIRGYG
jgi:hypothetical protein